MSILNKRFRGHGWGGRAVSVGLLIASYVGSNGLFSAAADTPPTLEAAAYCKKSYEEEGTCPERICSLACASGIQKPGCVLSCELKPCVEISVEDCPLDSCIILTGCRNAAKVCYYPSNSEIPVCGDLAYFGDDRECCKGLVKRCGIEFLDGRCEMSGEKSIYSVPICIPCGNGICNQFENKCNCPEDCG
ncbi:MAG TPA: hypothetical protein DD723_06330 [Candidatus Omnitrophica bacterium]|nr:MAG: hypothetical protein A2Z81_07755 [Omnitrophica WOR_2 bacterium GWA2_45_18]HBR15142.1 hypothetical protein [Candidatus Omnitrophota bacterium]